MSQIMSNLSPSLQRLSQALQSGNEKALELFWSEIKKNGTPLIEPIPQDEDYSQVTFIWKDEQNLNNIHIFCDYLQGDCTMIRMDNAGLWYKSYRLPNHLTTAYLFSLNETGEPVTAESFVERGKAGLYRSDPYNPDELLGENTAFPSESLLKMPAAAPEPWLARNPAAPKGKIEKHLFKSTLLKNERPLWVYTPAGYSEQSEKYPWLMMLDGGAYLDLGTACILDNLIAAQKIPPMAAIFVENYAHATRHIESSCNPLFARFLAEELVPWIQSKYHLSRYAEQAIIGGDSYTALSSTFAAWKYPNVFGNVLSQSAPFFWFQGMDRQPDPGEDQQPHWLIRRFETGEKLPLRLHLSVGALETGFDPHNKAQTSILDSNRHMHSVLRAKGYPIGYIESSGGHDFANWRQILPDAIIFLTSK